jgi:nucleotide-binding universal stress UspA family protein
MVKKNRIIALIDFSENSEIIIESAIAFSTITRAEIHLLHQVPSLTPVLSDSENKKNIIEAEKLDAKQKLDQLSRKYVLKNKFNYHITEKEITCYLRKIQKDNIYDWVLLGLKRTGNLKRIFLGSTATSIVDETDLLTIALPLQSEFTLPATLAVGIHYNYPINKTALFDLLQNLGNSIQHIEFFTVVTENDSEVLALQYIKELKQSYIQYNCEHQVFQGTQPLKEIKKYMLKNNNTYLVIQQGSRSLMDLLFRQLMVNELVYHAAIPLIILPK